MEQGNQFSTIKSYSIEFKHQVCRDHIYGGLRIFELEKKYNISSHSLVHNWLRSLGYISMDKLNPPKVLKKIYIGLENYQDLPKQSKITPPYIPKQFTSDEDEIAQLKRALEDAKIQLEGYKRMVEIAEQELKIPIRKKYNTK
jgi:transposase